MNCLKVQNISFGKKAKIADCAVQDRKTGKNVPAVFYEYDCKDGEDILEFNKTSEVGIPFWHNVMLFMQEKFEKPKENSNRHFYAIELPDGTNAGIAHTVELDNRDEIVHIGTRRKEYRLAGQNLIALVGHETVKRGKNETLHAWAPNPDALPFYTQACGFRFDKDYNLLIDYEGINKLYDKYCGKNVDKKA